MGTVKTDGLFSNTLHNAQEPKFIQVKEKVTVPVISNGKIQPGKVEIEINCQVDKKTHKPIPGTGEKVFAQTMEVEKVSYVLNPKLFKPEYQYESDGVTVAKDSRGNEIIKKYEKFQINPVTKELEPVNTFVKSQNSGIPLSQADARVIAAVKENEKMRVAFEESQKQNAAILEKLNAFLDKGDKSLLDKTKDFLTGK